MNGRQMTVEKRREYLFTKLTDGSYTQGRRQLRRSNPTTGDFDHCCLGVACDVFRLLTGEGRWVEEGTFVVESGLQSSMVMPSRVANFFGFRNDDGTYTGGQLTANNDNGKSFREIVEIARDPHNHVFM